MNIAIKTKLDSGIAKSFGGGITQTHWSRKVTARNLAISVKYLLEHYSNMVKSYGSCGHINSWIEINDHVVDCEMIQIDTHGGESLTSVCKKYLIKLTEN